LGQNGYDHPPELSNVTGNMTSAEARQQLQAQIEQKRLIRQAKLRRQNSSRSSGGGGGGGSNNNSNISSPASLLYKQASGRSPQLSRNNGGSGGLLKQASSRGRGLMKQLSSRNNDGVLNNTSSSGLQKQLSKIGQFFQQNAGDDNLIARKSQNHNFRGHIIAEVLTCACICVSLACCCSSLVSFRIYVSLVVLYELLYFPLQTHI
jgi:hypothetical protein